MTVTHNNDHIHNFQKSNLYNIEINEIRFHFFIDFLLFVSSATYFLSNFDLLSFFSFD